VSYLAPEARGRGDVPTEPRRDEGTGVTRTPDRGLQRCPTVMMGVHGVASMMPSPSTLGGVSLRLFASPRRPVEERLLWSRDTRFVRRLGSVVPGSRVLELDSGAILIGPTSELSEHVAHAIAREARDPEYGLVTVDSGLPEADRYLMALSAAVQTSGLAERIGMAQTTQEIQTKTLDYFFSLRKLHSVAFQPIVELATGELHEWECLFRPNMPMLPQSIGSIVQAAIDTDRSIELDVFLIGAILERAGDLDQGRRATGGASLRLAVNVTPPSLLDSRFEAAAFAAMVREAGLEPRNVTLECTEQQAVADVVRLQKAVKALRRAGFGFAVDDAGAGYASFALIAALRPTVIKIDRDIVVGIARDDAKQALVEAFVSFGRRIGARLLAEGIEKRSDLAVVTALGVDLGQGYLLGRPATEPTPPRSMETLRLQAARRAARVAGGHTNAGPRPSPPRRVRTAD
jgi:EAL domain-containing protein (putative c-di-GMP-specific phosphodiesterase class I)